MYRPTCNGYFSGGGGAEIGFMQAGIDMCQSLDLDPIAVNAMKANRQYFDHPVLLADIKEKTVADQPTADIVLATWPCKKYSELADLFGTRTGDDLYLHFFRMVVIGSPEVFVAENVPGMKIFPVVMEALTKLPGYNIQVLCPVKATNWLPQHRDRLIIVGTKKPLRIAAPSPAKNRVRIMDILEDSPAVAVPDYVLSRISGKYRDRPIIVDPADPDAVAPTCVAHYAKDMGTRLVKDESYKYGLRPFTIREYARLQGFPDDYHFESKLSSYMLIGNAVPPPMARWVGSEIVKYFN